MRSAALFLLLSPAALAQHEGMSMPQHEGMSMPQHDDMSGMSMNFSGMYLMRTASGTGMNPQSWRMPMWMPRTGSWTWMIMGEAFIAGALESGPRGRDDFYSVNWAMASVQRSLGRGSLMLQTMLSLDPATVGKRGYPLLFQTGEGLTDAQHPHDFVMSLGVQYARPIASGTMLHLYYAPVGDPALGPVAFPHRASAFELPQASLGHHWQDSTHLANNVATVAIKYRQFRLETSGFHGAEPDQSRWNIDWGRMDSYSARFSVEPSRNWLAQVSAGRLTNPEREDPGDVVRVTASVHYVRPSGWASSAIWGRNHKTRSGEGSNSFLLESVYPFTRKNFVTGRAEWVDKDELVVPGKHLVQGYTAGYTRDIFTFSGIETGLGANLTAYSIPDALKPAYGDHPWSANIFLRLRVNPRPQ